MELNQKSLKERLDKVDELLVFYIENWRMPKTSSTDVKEKSLAHFLNKMNLYPRHFKDEICKMNTEFDNLVKEFNVM